MTRFQSIVKPANYG